MSHLIYRRLNEDGTPTDAGIKYAHARYPWHHEVSREQAERMRQAMPTPDAFEIVEEGT